MSSTTSLNFSWAPLLISMTAMEAALTPLASPASLAKNSWLGTYPYGIPFSSQINGR